MTWFITGVGVRNRRERRGIKCLLLQKNFISVTTVTKKWSVQLLLMSSVLAVGLLFTEVGLLVDLRFYIGVMSANVECAERTMTMNKSEVDFCCTVEFETDSAYKVSDGSESFWIPKSQIISKRQVGKNFGDYEIVIPEWLAKEKGII
jgi:hypothetical protein